MIREPGIGPNRTGERLIKEWLEAIERRHRLERDLKAAESEVEVATRALAKWGLPKGTPPDEKVCFWVGTGQHDPERLLRLARWDTDDGADVDLVERRQGQTYTVASATAADEAAKGGR